MNYDIFILSSALWRQRGSFNMFMFCKQLFPYAFLKYTESVANTCSKIHIYAQNVFFTVVKKVV